MIRKYPSLFLLPFVVVGITLADSTHLSAELFLFLSLVACLVGFAGLRRQGLLSVVALALSLLFFSGFHFAIKYYDIGPGHFESVLEDGKVYRIHGSVSDWPILKATSTEIIVTLDSIGAEGVVRPVRGAILLKVTDATTALQRADRLEFEARVYSIKGSKWPSGFDYRRYLNLKGVSGVVYLPTVLDVRVDRSSRFPLFSFVDDLRAQITSCFYRNLTPTAAALASGFLIGETRDIPPEVYMMFRDSGTLHLLAVSGSNVALVVIFLVLVLRSFLVSRWRRAVVLVSAILVFTLLSYGEPSVVRASIMATLVIVAGLLERRYDLNNLIALTALVVLLCDPAQLFNVGFQLSFVTAWGLIFIVPKICGGSETHLQRGWYRWLYFSLVVSVVAQACSAPLVAYYFHRVPIISPLANLIIVPLVSVAVVGSLLLLLANLIWPLLGMLVGSLLNLLLTAIVFLLGSFGGEHVPVLKVGNLQPTIVILGYLYLVLAVVSFKRRLVRRVILLSLLFTANVALAVQIIQTIREPDGAELYVFSIPGGVAAVVGAPGSGQADLLITGAVGKGYPLDERIMAPALRALGISRINSFIVHYAEYGAIDDLLRLAHDYHTESLYVRKGIETSFEDVNNLQSIYPDSLKLTVYAGEGCPPGQSEPGYYPTRSGMLADFGSARLLLIDRFDWEDVDITPKEKPMLLLVGRTWRASPDDWIKLHRAGFRAIICSRVEQSQPKIPRTAGAPVSESAPDYVFDLSRVGGLRLRVSAGGTNTMTIAPLD